VDACGTGVRCHQQDPGFQPLVSHCRRSPRSRDGGSGLARRSNSRTRPKKRRRSRALWTAPPLDEAGGGTRARSCGSSGLLLARYDKLSYLSWSMGFQSRRSRAALAPLGAGSQRGQ
jgi:hypothetical protein